jgi:hypothetical protein
MLGYALHSPGKVMEYFNRIMKEARDPTAHQ